MIPDGWSIHPLEAIALVTSGGTPSRTMANYWDGNIPWVRTTEVQNCVIAMEDVKEFITQEGLNRSSAKIIPAGSILMAMIGQGKTRGQVALLSIDAACNQNSAAIVFQDGYSSEFFFNYLKSQYQNIRNFSNSAGQSNLSGALVKAIKVPVPSLPEQKKIAQILSTWDKAIETVEKLIENSSQKKKALMQQLLTGKKRFPGFDGEWRLHHLTEVAEIIVSPVDKKSLEGEVHVRLCNYTDVYYNEQITSKLKFMDATASQREIDRYTLQVGDVIITKDSETPGDIAVPAVVSEELNGIVCGYHLAIIRPKDGKVEGQFLNYLFSMPHTRYYFFTLANGVTRFGLPVDGIKKAELHLPPFDEQVKIAKVIRVFDVEIESHHTYLDLLRVQKKSLMQQLLTGKKRVQVIS